MVFLSCLESILEHGGFGDGISALELNLLCTDEELPFEAWV